jgi:predicted RNase H-like nuclease
MDTVLGVDACKAGWVGITWTGEKTEAHFAKHIAELADLAGDVAITAVDMPMGLTDHGFRRADQEARTFLGARRSSVFMTPVRATLDATSHEQANAINRAHGQKGMSIQTYSLLENIRKVDAWRRTDPGRVVEVHPEVSFVQLADGPLVSKKTWTGAIQRRRLLESAGIFLPDDLGEAGLRAAIDDVLDAAVAAWTARRVLDGTADPLPAEPEPVSNGDTAAIWR